MEVLFISPKRLLNNEEYIVNISIVIVSILVMLICRILWYAKNVPDIDLLYDNSSTIMTNVISNCQTLHEKYVPTYLWGKNGHFQSLLHTLLGRFGKIPYHPSERYELIAPDGSIVSYDSFEPNGKGSNEVVIIVPGICNHAESRYIKAFSYHLVTNGFRVIVFNHTGALKSVKLKRPRIFTYGETLDLDTVVTHLIKTEGIEQFIGLGFSLGGNILLKYLGENSERQKYFRFAVSVCQGYDIPEAAVSFREGENLRWMYDYGLTRNMLKVVNHHKDALVNYCQSEEPPINLNWDEIFQAKALYQLDKSFTLKLAKENDLDAFYRGSSSSQFMNKISIPMLIVNAQDDPIVPEKLFKYPKKLLDVNQDVLFVVTPHGGHLGFFEGGVVIPNRISWMDRMLTEFIKVATKVIKEENNNKS